MTRTAKSSFKPITATDPNVEITVSVEPEDCPIDMQSGDPAYAEADAQIEYEIRRSLECGNEYAWCVAVVTATYVDPVTGDVTIGRDNLGGVSCLWDDARDMSPEQCFDELVLDHGMQEQALADLNTQLRAAHDRAVLAAAKERVLRAAHNAVRRGAITTELARAVRALAKLQG